MPRPLQDNLRSHTVIAVVLFLCLFLGIVESILWGRTALDDMLPLWAMTLLLFHDQFNQSWNGTPSGGNRPVAWLLLLIAAAIMASGITLAKCPVVLDNGHISQAMGVNAPMVLRNLSLVFLALSVMLYKGGWGITLTNWLLPAVSLLLLPFYELLLLEFSFPLRLISTSIAVTFLRLLAFNIGSNGTTLLWQSNELAITDACSGMSLLGLLLLIAYCLVRKASAPAWQKCCWFSMLLIWILLSNIIRLILTLFGYMLWGEFILSSVPHFLLGCLFVIVCSLMLWFSSAFLLDDGSKQEETELP